MRARLARAWVTFRLWCEDHFPGLADFGTDDD